MWRSQCIDVNISTKILIGLNCVQNTGILLWCCDKCIFESDKNKFTYHPDEWKLAPIFHIEYKSSNQPLNYF